MSGHSCVDSLSPGTVNLQVNVGRGRLGGEGREPHGVTNHRCVDRLPLGAVNLQPHRVQTCQSTVPGDSESAHAARQNRRRSPEAARRHQSPTCQSTVPVDSESAHAARKNRRRGRAAARRQQSPTSQSTAPGGSDSAHEHAPEHAAPSEPAGPHRRHPKPVNPLAPGPVNPHANARKHAPPHPRPTKIKTARSDRPGPLHLKISFAVRSCSPSPATAGGSRRGDPSARCRRAACATCDRTPRPGSRARKPPRRPTRPAGRTSP